MDVVSRIREAIPELPAQQKVIAEAIVSDYVGLSFLSGNELADHLGVSNATVVRFAQKLGYTGYLELQQELQKLVQAQVVPMKKLRESLAHDREDRILMRVLEQDAWNLSQIGTRGLEDAFVQAVSIINDCKRLFIVGFRTSYTIAHYIGFLLNQFMPNARVVKPHLEDMFDELYDIGAEDCVFIIGFARYTRRTVEVARFAKQAGSRVICLTDHVTSPLVRYASVCLLAPNNAPHYSFVAPMSVANALIVALGRARKDAALERLRAREAVLLGQSVYE